METFDRMPWAAKDSVFRKLAEIGEVSNMTKEERVKYDDALRHYRDTLVVLEGARLRGVSDGKPEGRAEGRAEGILSVAKKMKSLGVPLSTIAKSTGLSAEVIGNL